MGAGKKRTSRSPRLRIGSLSIVPVVVLLVSGCMEPGDSGDVLEGAVLASLSLGAEIHLVEDEGNDSFDTALWFPATVDHPQTASGSIETALDVDVYDLGELLAGDRLVVDVVSDGYLDAIAAVFDGEGNLLYVNDDRNYFAGLRDPHIDFVLRRSIKPCYVAVASSPSSRSTGGYTLATGILPDTEVSPPQSQVVLLNFEGADSVEFGGRPPVSVPAFEATSISTTLAGETDELIELVLEYVREDYTGLNVEIFTSREAVSLGPDISTIHFGTYDRALLGVAENIDEFNDRTVQEGIIFTDTFQVFNVLNPTLEEYAQALANVASHEIGHLLGLVHTADTQELMDITASLRQLMREQAFWRAPLDRSTFPLGFQDAPQTLVESVGGDLEEVRDHSRTRRESALARLVSANDGEDDLPAPPRAMFSTCMHNACRIAKLKQRPAEAALGE